MGVVELDGEGPLPRVSSHSKSKSQPKITIEVSNATSVAMIKGVLENEALRTAKQEGKKPLEGGSREVEAWRGSLLESPITQLLNIPLLDHNGLIHSF